MFVRLRKVVRVAAEIDADGGARLRGEAQVGDGTDAVLLAPYIRAHRTHSRRAQTVVVHDVIDGVVVEI